MVRKPKNFNRKFLIDLGTAETPKWVPLAVGIMSHGSSFNETSEKFYYMSDEGSPDSDVVSQEVTRSFTGHRVVGDEAQDYILETVLYEINNRRVRFVEYDSGVDVTETPMPVNGWKGEGTLSISDDGSGDTASRQNISFSLSINGKPERGTMKQEDGVYTWTPKA